MCVQGLFSQPEGLTAKPMQSQVPNSLQQQPVQQLDGSIKDAAGGLTGLELGGNGPFAIHAEAGANFDQQQHQALVNAQTAQLQAQTAQLRQMQSDLQVATRFLPYDEGLSLSDSALCDVQGLGDS